MSLQTKNLVPTSNTAALKPGIHILPDRGAFELKGPFPLKRRTITVRGHRFKLETPNFRKNIEQLRRAIEIHSDFVLERFSKGTETLPPIRYYIHQKAHLRQHIQTWGWDSERVDKFVRRAAAYFHKGEVGIGTKSYHDDRIFFHTVHEHGHALLRYLGLSQGGYRLYEPLQDILYRHYERQIEKSNVPPQMFLFQILLDACELEGIEALPGVALLSCLTDGSFDEHFARPLTAYGWNHNLFLHNRDGNSWIREILDGKDTLFNLAKVLVFTMEAPAVRARLGITEDQAQKIHEMVSKTLGNLVQIKNIIAEEFLVDSLACALENPAKFAAKDPDFCADVLEFHRALQEGRVQEPEDSLRYFSRIQRLS